MKDKEYYFDRIKSTGVEIAHLANIVDGKCADVTPDQLFEWRIRRELLLEKLRIILDETEGCILQSMEDREK